MKTLKLRCFRSLLVAAVAVVCQMVSARSALPGEMFADFTKDGGWCWFADPRVVTRDGKTIAGWVTEDGSIQAGVLDSSTSALQTTMLHAQYQRDDHDNPVFLFLPDGRLMAFYSQHNGKQMNARVTARPGDFSEWEPESALQISSAEKKKVTYPNPVMLSAEDNSIYLFWRGDTWKPTLAKSTDDGKTWSEGKVVVSRKDASPNNRPYVKIASNGKDSIHMIFTDGHPRDEATNSVYYACYRKGAIYKADGTRIAGIEELPFTPEQADCIYDARKTGARAWVYDLKFDRENRPVIAYTRMPSEEDHRYHYARWDGKAWADQELCSGGKWFPQTVQGTEEREPHYTGGIALDPADPSVVYLSRPVKGVREIEMWTTGDFGKNWTKTAITAGSKNDNVRPYAVKDPVPGGPRLLWLNLSGRYVHFTDYLTSVKMDLPAKTGDVVNLADKDHPPLSDAIAAKDLMTAMQRVADWQLANPSKHRPTDWTQGAGYAGIMALAGVSGDRKYRDAMMAMGVGNGWMPGPRVYHADEHCVSQTYAELYFQTRDPKMLAPTVGRFEVILANPREGSLVFKTPGNQDRWSWCDALFMAPPAWLRMYVATGDKRYLNLAVDHWWRTSDFLYHKDEHLYFRDSTYFDKREANGKNVFWGRGNGWVMGGLVRMLQYLPSNHPARPRFEEQFKQMAAKLLTCQQPDGMWRASLLDPASYPLKEVSSTGFFTYAFAWGVNQGLLDRAAYEPAVRKAWTALVSCVQPDGKVTHVQPIGADPKHFADDATEVYGVGAFLLAGTEIYRLAVAEKVKPTVVSVTNPGDFSRVCETVEVQSIGTAPVVMDALTSRILDSQVSGKQLLFQVDLAPGETRNYLVLQADELAAVPKPDVKTFCRFVPERLDDFAWESDRIAHRVYGPAIIKDPKEKLISSGIDVWVKSARYPIIDKWYAKGEYHKDEGEGLDGYKVGKARGCGGLGIWDGKKLHTSSNYTKWKVIENGPLRSVFELTFDSWDIPGNKVSETKRVSIDAGSNFSRVESTFNLAITDKPGKVTVGVGIVKRPEGGQFSKDEKEGWMSYWEPEAAPNGNTACGVVIPRGATFAEADGNFLALAQATSGKPFVHYIGAGWSKSGDFPDAKSWDDAVRKLALRLKTPVLVKVK